MALSNPCRCLKYSFYVLYKLIHVAKCTSFFQIYFLIFSTLQLTHLANSWVCEVEKKKKKKQKRVYI